MSASPAVPERVITIAQLDRFNRARRLVEASRLAVLGSGLYPSDRDAVATVIDRALRDLSKVAVALGENP